MNAEVKRIKADPAFAHLVKGYFFYYLFFIEISIIDPLFTVKGLSIVT